MPMSLALFLAAVCSNPIEHVATDEVDLVEINHYYDERGTLVFDQIIFYDWCPSQSCYTIRDWRLLKRPAQIPYRDSSRGEYVAVWHDAKDHDVLRMVRSPALRETWTQYDPEVANRVHLPKERRPELRFSSVKVKAARIATASGSSIRR